MIHDVLMHAGCWNRTFESCQPDPRRFRTVYVCPRGSKNAVRIYINVIYHPQQIHVVEQRRLSTKPHLRDLVLHIATNDLSVAPEDP